MRSSSLRPPVCHRNCGNSEACGPITARPCDPVAGFEGLPYSDSDSAGAQLNRRGACELLQDTRRAIQTSRGTTAPLAAALSSVSSNLERRVVTTSATLRTLMIVGVGFACLLLPLLVYFQWLKAAS